MKRYGIVMLIYWATVITPGLAMAELLETVKGPDNHLAVSLSLTNGKPHYSVTYKGEVFLESSPLGLNSSIGDFSQGLTFIDSERNKIREQYELERAKVSQVSYNANGLTSRFRNAKGDEVSITFQVSDNDIALRYNVVSNNNATRINVLSEATSFNLPDNATTFITPQALPMTGWSNTKPSYEEPYTYDEAMVTASLYGVGYTFPALFKNAQKGWLLLSETGVDSHYVGSRLSEGNADGIYQIAFPQSGENAGIGETFASMALPATTPWRTITVGEDLAPIVETTISYDVVKPLYEPSEDYNMGRATWSWIVWQDDSINYEDQINYIDLAAELDFEYVLIDSLWDERIGRDKMEQLVAYAAAKKVAVILWYNSNGWWNEAPQTPQDKMNTAIARKHEMAWLQKIGVKGIKVDFFGGDKQVTMALYEDILSDANDYGIGVTFHGCTLPRGWARMYPNFVTSEAVLASENLVFNQHSLDQHAYNATILPFTRNTVAAMDFAPVFLNHRLSRSQERGTVRPTSDTFELATSVLYQSPVQHFGLTPNNLNEQPEHVLNFIRTVPSTWDEIQYIDGYPGKHIVMARRNHNRWYVAAVNGEKNAKQVSVSLPMLAGQTVQLLFDDANNKTQTSTVTIADNGRLTLSLKGQGGAVLVGQSISTSNVRKTAAP